MYTYFHLHPEEVDIYLAMEILYCDKWNVKGQYREYQPYDLALTSIHRGVDLWMIFSYFVEQGLLEELRVFEEIENGDPKEVEVLTLQSLIEKKKKDKMGDIGFLDYPNGKYTFSYKESKLGINRFLTQQLNLWREEGRGFVNNFVRIEVQLARVIKQLEVLLRTYSSKKLLVPCESEEDVNTAMCLFFLEKAHILAIKGLDSNHGQSRMNIIVDLQEEKLKALAGVSDLRSFVLDFNLGDEERTYIILNDQHELNYGEITYKLSLNTFPYIFFSLLRERKVQHIAISEIHEASGADVTKAVRNLNTFMKKKFNLDQDPIVVNRDRVDLAKNLFVL